jgi:phosphopantothenoylcysteine synthetase/decarboxylase
MPSALVTCGPAHEPIDEVRRLTNHSTGELGTLLAEALSVSGFEVVCLRAETATYPAPRSARVLTFSTNASMSVILEKLTIQPDAVFHAAALCDFLIQRIAPDKAARKIASTAEIHLILQPAGKILPRLRPTFPEALIVGWKYELDGSRQDAIQRARTQINISRTNACVLNGSAYGAGFGFLTDESQDVRHLADKTSLCEFLVEWTLQHLTRSLTSSRADQFPLSRADRSEQRRLPR